MPRAFIWRQRRRIGNVPGAVVPLLADDRRALFSVKAETYRKLVKLAVRSGMTVRKTIDALCESLGGDELKLYVKRPARTRMSREGRKRAA